MKKCLECIDLFIYAIRVQENYLNRVVMDNNLELDEILFTCPIHGNNQINLKNLI